jgi:hypothetical protein
MEPGVTAWSRAGSNWALPRSCIYRCRSCQTSWQGVRSTPWMARTMIRSVAIQGEQSPLGNRHEWWRSACVVVRSKVEVGGMPVSWARPSPPMCRLP